MYFNTPRVRSAIKRFIPLGFAITLIFFFIFLIVQQALRLGANEQVVQIAHDVSDALGQGAPYSAFSSPRPVNIASSLSPYAILFDQDTKMLTGSGVLDGEVPRPPKGVFDYVKLHHEERVTWSPKPGVRIALVGVYHSGVNPGFVFAGRSLREVENRIQTLLQLTLLAWLATLVASFLLFALYA